MTQQAVNKGFRQKKQPSKGQIQQENQSLEQAIKGKLMSIESQMQFMGSLLGQAMNQTRNIGSTVDALQTLAACGRVSEPAQKEDSILVDYTGILLDEQGNPEIDADGLEKRFQGGTGLKYLVQDLGSGQLLAGFEQALFGKSEGALVEADVEFPKDYGAKELAGRKAKFKIYVHAVYRRLPSSSVEVEVQEYQKRRAEILKAKAEQKASDDAQALVDSVDSAMDSVDIAKESEQKQNA